MVDLDLVRARWLELRDPEARHASRRAREEKVAREAHLPAFPADPLPWPHVRPPERALDGPAKSMTRVGVDAQDRPVIATAVDITEEWLRHLLDWSPGQ